MRNTHELWAAVAGTSVGEAWLRRDEPKPPEILARYRVAEERLARGVPFAYAVGRTQFRTLDLGVDARALIPRPETEGLVDLVLKSVSAGGIAADIGTGSGCLALALAVEGRFERVIAVEQSPAAASLARENVARINPRIPVEVVEGNLLAALGEKRGRYRVIVSNPPYLTAAEYADLDSSVRDFEPREALVSGFDGLAATRELFAGAGRFLQPGGLLALEIDERRAEAVRALARQFGWARLEIFNDLFARPRYALARAKED